MSGDVRPDGFRVDADGDNLIRVKLKGCRAHCGGALRLEGSLARSTSKASQVHQEEPGACPRSLVAAAHASSILEPEKARLTTALTLAPEEKPVLHRGL